jgi:hypothetical protein
MKIFLTATIETESAEKSFFCYTSFENLVFPCQHSLQLSRKEQCWCTIKKIFNRGKEFQATEVVSTF